MRPAWARDCPRGGLRTTLQTRSEDQARRLAADRENQAYLPGVELPAELRVETVEAGLERADVAARTTKQWLLFDAGSRS